MDILITDSILRDFLDTKATPAKIAECLSLCGPSIEKITTEEKETVYHIEVTTNRVDAASAKGIAREAAAILPQFGISAKMINEKIKLPVSKEDLGIDFVIDEKLCERLTAIKFTNIEVGESPLFIKNRIVATGVRAINNVIDITNYAMMPNGIPMHAFDYDKLGDKVIIREAKKGEKFVTLDHKSHIAAGGEVVFDNGKGDIVDLPGVMGTENTMVTESTKNVLLVFEHIDHHRVREASLTHETRSNAAILNEKNPDPNGIDEALIFASDLFLKHTKGKISSKIFNWYPKPRKEHTVTVSEEDIDRILGKSLGQTEISKILESLNFKVIWRKNQLEVIVPTFRADDVTIPEDIIEEIARIYGYFKLPSVLPEGALPKDISDSKFKFEFKIKKLLQGWGGVEVYTLSMVSRNMADEGALHIKNPLGGDGEYMRTKISPSLLLAAKNNSHEKQPFHLFEVANVYLPRKKDLPIEETHLSGIFANTDYRKAKGILEALFSELNIKNAPVLLKTEDYFVYEYSISDLVKESEEFRKFTPISTFPPQIEDLTLVLGETKVGEVISTIKAASKLISDVIFLDSYEGNYSFRLSYQDQNKTLTDGEVTDIREEVLNKLQKEFAVTEKN